MCHTRHIIYMIFNITNDILYHYKTISIKYHYKIIYYIIIKIIYYVIIK